MKCLGNMPQTDELLLQYALKIWVKFEHNLIVIYDRALNENCESSKFWPSIFLRMTYTWETCQKLSYRYFGLCQRCVRSLKTT